VKDLLLLAAALIFAIHYKMSEPQNNNRRIVIKLNAKTPPKTVTDNHEAQLPTTDFMERAQDDRGAIISGERMGLMGGREGLLGDYYDNLERTVLELSKSRQFLECYRSMR
jgi:hypothetical protein